MAEMHPLHEGLFVDDGETPRLIGSRCTLCGATTFPVHASCPRCCSDQTSSVELTSRGTLWSWTIQRFRPKQPYLLADADGEFVPYGVGYVKLADGVIVESVLTTADPDELQIGAPMQLVLYRIDVDGAENSRTHFAFSPIEEAGS